MKKLLILLFSLLFLSSSSVFAMNISLSCEAKRVEGDGETLEYISYGIIYPNIIINLEKKEIIYSYFEHDRRWTNTFMILKEDEFNIMGAKDMDIARNTTILHFNKQNKTFSNVWIGNSGSTTTYGRCFD